ncbi:MAG TPA: protein translocase subunit SecF [Proteobacteria bacterium]|nr:protein translocase subunit SecF [Pseudomonadota bacterium]
MEFFKPDININFIGRRYIAFAVSAALVAAGLLLFFVKGPNYGIDFAGGVEVRVDFKQDPGIGEIRKSLKQLEGVSGLEVQRFIIPGRHVYTIKAKGEIETTELKERLEDVASRIFHHLQNRFGKDNVSIISTDLVGPRVGAELRKKGLLAIVFALIGILIYIGYRFDYKFAPGAVIALAHDVVITTGFLIALNREFSLTVIAALLTIAGYSINDTIVVFDRIREGRTKYAKLKLEERVNKSINETLSRTILTSLTTLIVVVALLLFGGEILRDFALAMVAGIVVGTYSSIFVASPIYIELERKFATRTRKYRRR